MWDSNPTRQEFLQNRETGIVQLDLWVYESDTLLWIIETY
jgi:hypothetical protein